MFSNIEDSNRIIPRMRKNIISASVQYIFVLFILLLLAIPFLSGEFGRLINEYDDYIFIPILILVLGVSIVSSFYINWDLNRRWERLAADFALQLEKQNRFAPPRLTGTFRGHKVTVEITAVKRGRNRTYYTNFFITLPQPVDYNLSFKKRNLISLNRETVGDDEIDKKLKIDSSSDDLLRRILTTNRLRQGLLELGEKNRLQELSITENKIHYVERERISDDNYIHAVLRYLGDLANLVERFDHLAF